MVQFTSVSIADYTSLARALIDIASFTLPFTMRNSGKSLAACCVSLLLGSCHGQYSNDSHPGETLSTITRLLNSTSTSFPASDALSTSSSESSSPDFSATRLGSYILAGLGVTASGSIIHDAFGAVASASSVVASTAVQFAGSEQASNGSVTHALSSHLSVNASVSVVRTSGSTTPQSYSANDTSAFSNARATGASSASFGLPGNTTSWNSFMTAPPED